MVNNKDKRAWVRLVEAFFSILILASSVFLIVSNSNENRRDFSGDIYENQRQILDFFSKNETIRNYVLAENITLINSSIDRVIPKIWGYDTNICDINDNCPGNNIDNSKNTYVSEIIISSNYTYYSPKKLRFFVWMK